MKYKHQLLPFPLFFIHFARSLTIAISFIFLILLIGMIGLRLIENPSWLDAYTNCAMIITGVGILTSPATADGKFFVGTYCLIGEGCYLLVIAVIFFPIFHWMGRKIKVEDREHF